VVYETLVSSLRRRILDWVEFAVGGGRGQPEAELLPLVLLSVLLGSVEPLPTLVGKQECASHLHARQKLFLCGYPHFCGAFHCWL